MNRTVVLLDIDYTLFDTKTFKESSLTEYSLYTEVLHTLKKLKGVAELGIFSKGDSAFQNTKLRKTGIKNLFNEENIHVFEDKDVNINIVLEIYKDYKIFLVDDKLSVLYAAKSHNSAVVTIWVKRGPFAENQKPLANFSPDATIEDLSSLDKIINQS
jgi:phosphoglycolate phosphatase-like HAD superfamily hydrolase